MDRPRADAAKSQYRPLPNGWRYLLERQDVRALVAEFGAQFLRVAFRGPCHQSADRYGLGELFGVGEVEVRGTAAGWRFRIELSGLPTQVLGEHRERLRESILAEIRRFCGEFPPGRADATAPGIELRLWVRRKNGILTDDCSRWRLEGADEARRRATDPWWR